VTIRVVIHNEGLAMKVFSKFSFNSLKMVKSSSLILVKKMKQKSIVKLEKSGKLRRKGK